MVNKFPLHLDQREKEKQPKETMRKRAQVPTEARLGQDHQLHTMCYS